MIRVASVNKELKEHFAAADIGSTSHLQLLSLVDSLNLCVGFIRDLHFLPTSQKHACMWALSWTEKNTITEVCSWLF